MDHKEEIGTQPEQQEEKRIKKENTDSIRSLWAISNRTNIRMIGMSEEEEEQEVENLLEKIIQENFLHLVKEIDTQVQEAQRVPNKLDPNRTTPRHIIIKMTKVKDEEI